MPRGYEQDANGDGKGTEQGDQPPGQDQDDPVLRHRPAGPDREGQLFGARPRRHQLQGLARQHHRPNRRTAQHRDGLADLQDAGERHHRRWRESLLLFIYCYNIL